MNNIKLYKNIGLIVWIIVTVILAYLVFKPSINQIDNTVANARIDSLESEKKVLIKHVLDRDTENESSKKVISYLNFKSDSLLNVISKTPAKYANDYKKIDDASAASLVNQFSALFSENNVKP